VVTRNIEFLVKGNDENIEKNEMVCQDKEIEDAEIFQAMLTQKEPTDKYYEQYTIHTLNEPRKNSKATDLYQMLKIDANPIDQRDLKWDLKCFPHLFPYVKNGQYS